MKTRRRLLLVSLICLSRATAARAGDNGSWEQEVRAAEGQHRTAFLAGDVTALQELFSDELVVNSPLYAVVQKKQVLDMVRNGILTISSFDQKIEEMHRFGDIVVVMGGDTVVYVAPAPNAGQAHRRRFSDFWRVEGGRWRLVARHANLICQ